MTIRPDSRQRITLRRTFLAAGVIVFVLVSTVVRADGDDPKALFERATVQFRLGQFHEAALTYERVYALHHDPALLYNCAQSYRLANEHEKALLLYKSFLSSKPDAANREEVQGRIAELEAIVAEEKKAKERPPNDVATAPAPPTPAVSAPTPPSTAKAVPVDDRGKGRTKKIAGIALCGLAVGAVVGGIVTAVLSGQASDSINAAARSGQPFDPSKESDGKADTIVSGVMFGVAGAAAVAGSVLLALGIRDSRAHESRISLSPTFSPTSVGAAASVRFSMEGLLSMQLRFILIAIALSSGCYKLNLENGQLRCSVPDKKCPSSFHCATDGYCWKNGQDPSSNMPDMAGILDSTDLGAADMAQGPPAPNKGGVVLSGGVTAQSPH